MERPDPGVLLYQCNRCHHQTSLISGTIFEQTKVPLTRWFLAIHLITQSKTGLAALALKREIGVSYNTAWSMKHKIRNLGSGLSVTYLYTRFGQMEDQ